MNIANELEEGYDKALALLKECVAPDGFVASPSHHDNYRRIWGRDGTIMSLAALLSGNDQLIETARRTFETLAKHQGPHGEIPSNVDTGADRISYGGTTGRVDTDLWFMIGCGEYWLATGDDSFLDKLLPAIERVRFLLGAWEMNNRGLIYVPLAGDWADEYLQNGYEYHNGGLWPMITGFYVADLARRQQTESAKTHLLAIHRANALVMDGEAWGFPEFVHGRRLTPGGNRHQGWSAAAAIIGHHAVDGKSVFRVNDEESDNH